MENNENLDIYNNTYDLLQLFAENMPFFRKRISKIFHPTPLFVKETCYQKHLADRFQFYKVCLAESVFIELQSRLISNSLKVHIC